MSDALCNGNGEQLTVRPGQGLMQLCIDPPVDVPVGTASTIGDDLTMPIGDPADINVVTAQPVTPPVGWRCPGCQQCFAPATPKCDTCGQTQGNGSFSHCIRHGYLFDPDGSCPVCSGRITG